MLNKDHKFEIYKDSKGEWRWRYKQNGHIMADSGEGYATSYGAKRSLKGMWWRMIFAKIEEV